MRMKKKNRGIGRKEENRRVWSHGSQTDWFPRREEPISKVAVKFSTVLSKRN